MTNINYYHSLCMQSFINFARMKQSMFPFLTFEINQE